MTQSSFWGSPVIASTIPVVKDSRWVRTNAAAVDRVAGWMAYEEFGLPDGAQMFDFGSDPDLLTDVTLFVNCLNFAFTDFATSRKFELEYRGRTWSDSEAMVAALHRAHVAGEPIFTGAWMAGVTRADLERLFAGSIEMPMLDERVAILRSVGATLVDRFGGSFHAWAAGCEPAMYADGNGLLERLVTDFPRFEDSHVFKGSRVRIYKLAQLALWGLHAMWVRQGRPGIRDLDRMSAFADYIVPVALRVMGIFQYVPDLERRIMAGEPIARDSEEEIEIRAHTLYATALLTDALNELRPPELRLVIPQVDYRLWKSYHATFHPHHLTVTTMY